MVSKSVFSANIAPPAQDPYNEPYHDSYRPDRDFDRRDNRDRDRRTFASRDYEPQRTSHWDNNRYSDCMTHTVLLKLISGVTITEEMIDNREKTTEEATEVTDVINPA